MFKKISLTLVAFICIPLIVWLFGMQSEIVVFIIFAIPGIVLVLFYLLYKDVTQKDESQIKQLKITTVTKGWFDYCLYVLLAGLLGFSFLKYFFLG